MEATVIPNVTKINHAGEDALLWMKAGMTRDNALLRVYRDHHLSADEYFIVRRSIEQIAEEQEARAVSLLAL